MESKLKIYKQDSTEKNELPDICLSFKKLFPSASDGFIKNTIKYNAGMFYDIENIIILSYGEFTKSLLKKYNRTIEKQTCNIISHEIVHWCILNQTNIKVCSRFDNIAEKLSEYGVY